MSWFLWTVASIEVLNILAMITIVGRPRAAITGGDAAWYTVIHGAITVGLVLMAMGVAK